jgi:hypothetical protein
MRYFLACLLVILLLVNVSPVLAGEMNKMPEPSAGQINEALNNLTPVRFLPNNPLYFLIRGKEMISRFFQPSFRERAQFDYAISSKRLKEAYLLYDRGDLGKTPSELSSYTATLGRIEGQLEKARSQNQDITVIVDRISDNLKYQEVILLVFKNLKDQNQFELKDRVGGASNSFNDFVLYLDKIKPGVRNRFQLIDTGESDLKALEINKSRMDTNQNPMGESSAQAKPRKIIY